MIQIKTKKIGIFTLVLAFLLIFYTTLVLAVGEFVIDASSGNIGIGTTDTGVINTDQGSQWGLNTTDKVFVISGSGAAVLNLENTLPFNTAGIVGKKLGAVVFSSTVGQGPHKQLAGIVSRITGISGSGSTETYLADLRFFTKGATVAGERMTITSDGKVGIGTISPNGTLSVGSTDASNELWMYHDNTDAYFKTDDGAFVFQTDEGPNTNTYLDVKGKGAYDGVLRLYTGDGTGLYSSIYTDSQYSTYFKFGSQGLILIPDNGPDRVGLVDIKGQGTGYSMMRMFDQDDAEHLDISIQNGHAYFSMVGTAPGNIYLQHGAPGAIDMFSSAAEGETRELSIYGYKTGDSLKSLQIGVGVDAADTASFDGVSTYYFDGNISTTGIITDTGDLSLKSTSGDVIVIIG